MADMAAGRRGAPLVARGKSQVEKHQREWQQLPWLEERRYKPWRCLCVLWSWTCWWSESLRFLLPPIEHGHAGPPVHPWWRELGRSVARLFCYSLSGLDPKCRHGHTRGLLITESWNKYWSSGEVVAGPRWQETGRRGEEGSGERTLAGGESWLVEEDDGWLKSATTT